MKKPTLYHAISMENFHTAICLNALRGYSTHRIADNGLIPWCQDSKNPSPAYLESKWYFGVCLTRELGFALGWNDVVLSFDRQALVARNRVVPYNWMETRVKCEAEEFVVTGAAGFTCGQALLHWKDNKTPEEQVRRNSNFLAARESYVGEIDRLGRLITKITVQVRDRPGLLKLKNAEAEKSHYAWKLSKFSKLEKDLKDYCQEHDIPLEVQT